MYNYTLENGKFPDLTEKQFLYLFNIGGLIYPVGYGHCKFADGICFDDIELALKGLPNE